MDQTKVISPEWCFTGKVNLEATQDDGIPVEFPIAKEGGVHVHFDMVDGIPTCFSIGYEVDQEAQTVRTVISFPGQYVLCVELHNGNVTSTVMSVKEFEHGQD